MAVIEKYTTGEDESYAETLDSNDWLCQTITIGTVGLDIASIIDRVDLKIANVGAGLIYASIYAVTPQGAPTGSSLSTGSAAASLFDAGATGIWGSISMSSYTLQPATKYALILSADSACSVRADGSAPSYTGGTVWFSADSGATWTEDATTDFMFQVNGGTEETGTLTNFGEVLNKMGANANATAQSPLLLTSFIQQAESKLNALTLKDWVSAYSGLSENKKYVLNDTVSTLAAIYGINYGETAGGFTLQSQRKIENLRVLANENIRELKDDEVRTFMEAA